MSGGAATFEGHFEILSLSGSFLLSEIGGQRRRTGGLSVSLAGSDGRVFGGSVAGVLTAASPIQIIVGDFVANGRIPSTCHHQQIPGSTGSGIIPHIIKVKTGEDVSSKILSFTHYCPRAVCISSATGELSSVRVLQADTSRGIATYEGLFNILTLSGSFLPSENGDQRSRTGGFSVSFTGSKRRIFGGAVAGALIAASPVEVSVFSFGPAAGLMNLKSVGQTGASTAPSRGMYSGLLSELAGQTGANTPPSRGMYSGLLSELPSHPKSKRSGNRKR
ncbi:AT-hook motif nuclear-localized protein 10-like isoform X2 [Solanum dulcamara]|nr:AT-hook motif nuclear-localized protein 10-like isoform X2 [Solanum dulcamara]XP_055811839.1 AT-hook motif nuclear-localized protein 10-like isoform X2 [Solanum dulcamara]